jgi:hypothetical protein
VATDNRRDFDAISDLVAALYPSVPATARVLASFTAQVGVGACCYRSAPAGAAGGS